MEVVGWENQMPDVTKKYFTLQTNFGWDDFKGPPRYKNYSDPRSPVTLGLLTLRHYS